MTKGLIVLIEDEPNCRRFVKTALEHEGFEVEAHVNGHDGEEAIKNTMPDLAVIDVMLPRKPGLDICLELKKKKKYHDIPVLLITGLTTGSEKDDEYWKKQTGADGFLSKPFSVEELMAGVNELLAPQAP